MTTKDTALARSGAGPGSWVQTERRVHEEWAKLTMNSPRAAAALHILTSRVGDHNAVVISHAALAALMGCNRRTVVRALEDLARGNWLEVRYFGERGGVNAYVLNDRVAWHISRDGRRYSLFSAAVIASADEQPDAVELGKQEALRRLPRAAERQLPSGPGLPPPSQPFLPDMEPELPVIAGTDRRDDS